MSYTDAPAVPPGEDVPSITIQVGRRHIQPAHRTDIAASPAVAIAASRQVLGGGDVCELLGWSIRETTGAAVAAFRLRDGHDATGEVLACVNLAVSESDRDWFAPAGIEVFTGRVFIEVLAGSVDGVVYWR